MLKEQIYIYPHQLLALMNRLHRVTQEVASLALQSEDKFQASLVSVDLCGLQIEIEKARHILNKQTGHNGHPPHPWPEK